MLPQINFKKRDIVIPNQDNQEQIISTPKDTSNQNSNDFLRKILTKNGIANTPNNEKLPNNQIVISISNPSPIIHLQPEGIQMQKLQTPFQGNSSNFSNICDYPDFMDTLAKKILQHLRNK